MGNLEKAAFDLAQRNNNQIGDLSTNIDNQFTSLETANGKDSLNLTNYLGNTQNIHPKVLYFPNKWNGFEYWMAYTPYPFGDTTAENPCIAVSSDKFNWSVPNGVTNPLDPAPSVGYNSDTHLVYREDTNTLEVWWRYANETTSTATIYRRTSTDGINWTAKESILILNPLSSNDMLSPAVIFENGKYKMWSCLKGKVRYCESTDNTAKTWNSPVEIVIDWGILSAWHLDVIKTDLGYEMIVCAYEPGGNNNTADLYYVIQKIDGSTTKPKSIIKRSKNITALDYQAIYRSSFIKQNGSYSVFYSGIAYNSARSITISTGTNIFGLNGYTDYKKKPNSKVVRVAGGSTLTDYDVSNIDVIIINGTTPVTINSLKGGYEGKEIKIIVEGSVASAKIVYGTGSRILLPGLKDYTLTITQMGMNLICTNTSGTTWRGFAAPDPTNNFPTNAYIRLTDATNPIAEYNVGTLETIAFQSSAAFSLESLTGGYIGKQINIIVIGSASVVNIVNSSRITTPNGQNYSLTITKGGVRLVCTAAGVWRMIE